MPKSRNNLSDHQLWRSSTFAECDASKTSAPAWSQAPGRGSTSASAIGDFAFGQLNPPARRTVFLGSERMTNACGNSRHSVATSMLRHGASLQEVAALLRHQSITTTEIYARSM